MGDGGEKYTGFDDALCESIKALCLCADVITPNETELYILTGERDINKAAQGLIAAAFPQL
jgi:pyridoxal/pyridoxine/pyridoxamine kinase